MAAEQRRYMLILLTRRTAIGILSAPLLNAAGSPLRVGVTDWNLKMGANSDAVALAAKLGFDGVQVSFGRKITDGKLPLDDSALIARYKGLAQENHIPIDGTCVDMLHTDGLKNGGQALKWVSDAIRITHLLGSRVLLLPFFGVQATKTQAERDRVADALRELSREAERDDVILGLENENSAEENIGIMERSRSECVRVYYDLGNSTNIGGYDVEKEIRLLGAARICQFHLKDKPVFLGQGKIQFDRVLRAIHDVEYTGFANLETDSRPGLLEDDMRTNLGYVRKTDAGVMAQP